MSEIIPFDEPRRILSKTALIPELEHVLLIYTTKDSQELYMQSSVSDSATLVFWLSQMNHAVIKRAE